MFKRAFMALIKCEGYMVNSPSNYQESAYREKLVHLCKDILKEAGELK
jgi:hypothetical protein